MGNWPTLLPSSRRGESRRLLLCITSHPLHHHVHGFEVIHLDLDIRYLAISLCRLYSSAPQEITTLTSTKMPAELLNFSGFKDNASIVDLRVDDIITFERIWILSIYLKAPWFCGLGKLHRLYEVVRNSISRYQRTSSYQE